MNKNPPSGQAGWYQQDTPGIEQDFNAAHMDGNPYYNQQGASAPDLEAGAPLLKASEQQRMNRKALLFLAGIVGLLLLMAVWLLKTATSGGDEVSKLREETVVIPELPQAADSAESARDGTTGTNAAEPIDLADSRHPELPPLPPTDISQPAHSPDFSASLQLREPTLLERRMSNVAGGGGRAGQATSDPYLQAMLAALPGSQTNTAQAQAQSNPTQGDVSSVQFIDNPDALLVRGTYIRCVLESRIITDIPGFTSCVVTEPVYSITGRRLLLPKGSKMVGKYNSNDPRAPRVAVIWDRITTPNGIDVSMASPGVDSLGGAGHPGDYDAHWLSRMSAALMISLVSDAFQYAGAKYGPETTAISNGVVVQSPYDSSTARTMERLANEVLDRGMSRPDTVTINQGTVINVYVAKDVDFSRVLSGS